MLSTLVFCVLCTMVAAHPTDHDDRLSLLQEQMEMTGKQLAEQQQQMEVMGKQLKRLQADKQYLMKELDMVHGEYAKIQDTIEHLMEEVGKQQKRKWCSRVTKDNGEIMQMTVFT